MDKNHRNLEEYGVTEGAYLTLEYLDKSQKRALAPVKGTSSVKRERKPKEIQKAVVEFAVRDSKLHDKIEVSKSTKIK